MALSPLQGTLGSQEQPWGSPTCCWREGDQSARPHRREGTWQEPHHMGIGLAGCKAWGSPGWLVGGVGWSVGGGELVLWVVWGVVVVVGPLVVVVVGLSVVVVVGPTELRS